MGRQIDTKMMDMCLHILRSSLIESKFEFGSSQVNAAAPRNVSSLDSPSL